MYRSAYNPIHSISKSPSTTMMGVYILYSVYVYAVYIVLYYIDVPTIHILRVYQRYAAVLIQNHIPI